MEKALSNMEEYFQETDATRKKGVYLKIIKKLLDNGKFQDSLKLSKMHYDFCLENNYPEEQAKALINLGLASFYLNNEEQAIKHNLEAVEIFYSLGNLNGVAEVFNCISGVFYSKKEFSKAVEYMNKAIDIMETQEEKPLIRSVYLNLSRIYKDSGQIEKALINLKKAENSLQEPVDKCSNKLFVMNFYITASELDTLQGKHDSALRNINVSLHEAEKLNNPHHIIISTRAKAHILSNIGKTQEAIDLLEGILHYFEKEEYEDLYLHTLKSISALSEKKGDIEKAFEFYQKYLDLYQEVDNKKIIRKTEQLEAKFDEIINDKEKELFRLKNVELEETLNKLNQAYKELLLTQQEKIRAEKLNAALKTIIETASIIEKPLSLIEKNLSAIMQYSSTEFDFSKNYDRIKQNTNRIRLIMNKFSKLKDVKLTEYVTGVKMLELENECLKEDN